ncbi:hypothetical protein GLYMA_06G107000v4 [Glycine max]|nr:hypothetical protein GLYMA_06G107000v4 [Glycine max]KAH1125224.1 hypothetical protein GYH30_014702 [Glycine max]
MCMETTKNVPHNSHCVFKLLLYGEHSSLRTHDRSSDISNWIGAPYYYYLWLNPLVSMSPTILFGVS